LSKEKLVRKKTEKSGRKQTPHLIEYTLPGPWTVLVGRTDRDNDYLSLKVAKANDYWFHVRGMPASHVILQVPSGEEPDRETLRQAAAIAAYHSKAREGGVVPVSCTQARFVTKPRGAKPGTVQIRKEFILKVRPGIKRGDMGKQETEIL
jgi:predicted ribosome quality control (RQC) complex YloA/Tae2 family protein